MNASSRYSQKDFLRSQSVVRKRQRQRRRKIIWRTALFLILVIALISVSWLSQLSIQKVIVAGISGASAASVEMGVNSVLDGTYLKVLPKKNFLLFPKGDVAKQIMDEHPEIGSVSIHTEHMNTLNIRVTERTPAALWCKDEKCYMVDKNAFVYANEASSSVPQSGKKLGLRSIYDTSSSTAKLIGNKAMSAEEFAQILAVADNLSSSSLPVENISIEDGGKYVFKIENNGKIIFSNRKPLQKSYDELMSALHAPVFATSGKFQYIDTRFGNKVFYRLGSSGDEGQIEGGELPATSSSSTVSISATSSVR